MKHGTFVEGETTASTYDSKQSHLHDDHVTHWQKREKEMHSDQGQKTNMWF